MMAGIDHANGEVIICMDSDLQHPPEKIPELYDSFLKGNDIILMIRKKRKDKGKFYNFFLKFFTEFSNFFLNFKIFPNASDFFLISSKVSNILKADYRKKSRFIR